MENNIWGFVKNLPQKHSKSIFVVPIFLLLVGRVQAQELLEVNSLDNLAESYINKGNYSLAEPLYIEALAIRKKALGAEHPSYANSLGNLATVYYYQGNYAKAEPLYLETLAIYKKDLGKNHPDYAISLNNLALLYSDQCLYAKAEPLYQEVLAIYKKALGEEHPDYASSLGNLGVLYAETGKDAMAAPLLLKNIQIQQHILLTQFQHLTEKGKEQFYTTFSRDLEIFHSFTSSFPMVGKRPGDTALDDHLL